LRARSSPRRKCKLHRLMVRNCAIWTAQFNECLVHSARDCECESRRGKRAQQRRWFVVLLEQRDTQPGSTRTNFSTRFLTVGYSSNVGPHAQEPLKSVGERRQRHAESEREARGLMLNGQGRRRARGTKACAKRVPAAARMLGEGERTRPRGRGPSTRAVGPEVHRQKAGEERGRRSSGARLTSW
jgi:hypothetical protein